MKKLEIDRKAPAPGDYQELKALKDQVYSGRYFKFKTDQRVAYTDVYAKKKQKVPAPTQYKYDVNNSLNRLSGSPRSLAVRRH